MNLGREQGVVAGVFGKRNCMSRGVHDRKMVGPPYGGR